MDPIIPILVLVKLILVHSLKCTVKVLDGVDPKSVFCAFFKQGLCKKGDRCKFSHDPDCERKAAKRNIYAAEDDEEGQNYNNFNENNFHNICSHSLKKY